jgi:proline dehydrogenase
MEPAMRHSLNWLAAAPWARSAFPQLPGVPGLVDRFVAGESADDAIAAARGLRLRGFRVSLDLLGESVAHGSEAVEARDEILRLFDQVQQAGVEANVSVKLSQLGLKISRDLALHNMRLILERARTHGNWVRIDMEESALTTETLDIYHQLRGEGFDNVGTVVQAYLYRTAGDVERLIEAGARVRLCKGAYNEPAEVAFPLKADTDDNFVRLMQTLLGERAREKGVWPAIATHDNRMVQETIDFMRAHNLPKSAVEFQMLYGVRRDLQDHLVGEGYPVRIYVPFGRAWYPYFMRRLAERPANVAFFLNNL